jgi:REP element-mobilizing transposase RayT
MLRPMTAPRSQLIDPSTPGFFHCVSRCVRRAFLCGSDSYTGQSFEHRRQWVEDRLLELADSFAVGLYAYAVMSNHLHVVLYVDPIAAEAWSAEEVAERWVRLFPVRIDGVIDPEACRLRQQALSGNAERIAELRQRLGSVSWFMRCLSEPIARRANREDGCTGRFWEGRFKCQALLDEAAVAACMAYVDLNPVRAGIADDLLASEHTSIRRRIDACDVADGEQPLAPVAGSVHGHLGVGLLGYIELADWTGRMVRGGKRGVITATAPAALARLGLVADQWERQVLGIESRYWRAVGAVDALLDKARALGQCWLKGVGAARLLRTCTVQ